MEGDYTKHGIGDGPIQPEYFAQMQAIARAIDEFLNGPKPRTQEPKTGFVLLMFKFGDAAGGRMNYMSNAQRADIVQAFKEQLKYIEAQGNSGEPAK